MGSCELAGLLSRGEKEPRHAGSGRSRAVTDLPSKSGRNAALVAAGILLSRVVGLVRQKLLAHMFGSGLEMAAFAAATRIPNVLQNLLGEGVLSASFIPVYAGLRATKEDAEAVRVAGAVFGLLSLLVGALVALGLLAAPALVRLVAPGYTGEAFLLTVELVRIIFPATGVLVLSAWCLGILNSHRRFFLSYAAPVVSSLAVITAIFLFRHDDLHTLIIRLGWATVAGAVLQFGVQLPQVIKLLGRFNAAPSFSLAPVRSIVTRFLPAVAARGVVQISAWVDTAYASLITERAVSALTYSQTIALLPISLFGMSISAAELPDMSADAEKSVEERNTLLRARLRAGLERMRFFVVPSAVAFVALGDLISGALLQSGKFTARDSRFVWYILIGSGLALIAQTSGRLYASAFYALKDTRTPLMFAIIRVTLGIALGFYAVRILPGQIGLPVEMGAVFVTATTSVTAWVEMLLLRRALRSQLQGAPTSTSQHARVWFAAIIAGALALALKAALSAKYGVQAAAAEEWGGEVLAAPALPVLPMSLTILTFFGAAYLVVTSVLRVPQSVALFAKISSRISKS